MTAVPYTARAKATELGAGPDESLEPADAPVDAERRTLAPFDWSTTPTMRATTFRRELEDNITLDPDIALWPTTQVQRWPFTGSPAVGIWPKGWLGVDNTATLWVCTLGGQPGTWAPLSGPAPPALGILAYKLVQATQFVSNNVPFQLIDPSLTLSFTVPASGKVVLSISCKWNVGVAGESIQIAWSLGTTNNAGLLGNAQVLGTLTGSLYLRVDTVNWTGLTPGASVTVAPQWAPLSVANNMAAGNQSDIILTAMGLP